MPPAREAPATVELPRGALIALCAALGVTLLALAFLLGRVTARPAPQLAQATPAEAAPATPVPGVAEAPDPLQPAAPPESAPPEALSRAGTPAPSVNPSERAAVAAYFAQLERLEASGKTWGDPQQLALQLVQQSAQGDRRAFEELLSTERQARESLRALPVPPACREHHAEALALMDEAIGLLGRLGQAMASQDLTALQGFVSTAHELEARTRRLDALGTSLKRQYGIAATPRPS